MNRSVIFIIVFMVFAYLVGKYKLIPYLAAKKILKDAKKGNTEVDNVTAAPALPQINPVLQAAMMGGYAPLVTQPTPERTSRRDMYFDACICDLNEEDDLERGVNEMLVALRNRGICPDLFNIIYVGDGQALAYVTYVL